MEASQEGFRRPRLQEFGKVSVHFEVAWYANEALRLNFRVVDEATNPAAA